MPEDHEIRATLAALRDDVQQALTGMRTQAETVELDQTAVGRLSRVDALQAQAMAQAQERRAEIRLKQIDNALARLEHGAYGVCMRCGDDIAEARLTARPETPFCRECA